VTIPNFITIARLLSVPLIIWLIIADRFMDATIVFILAGLSDAADGFIAKRFGAASELGAYLDPIADKALLVSAFVTLGFKGALPAWLAVLVVSRDFLIIGGIILAYMLATRCDAPPWVSKANTVAQIVLLALVLFGEAGATVLRPLLAAAVLLTAALTVASAAAYIIDWVRHMAGASSPPQRGGR
jgi:cardiolipin synthase